MKNEEERIAERIRSLKKLADFGKNPHEREAAQKLFERLVRKHGFDLSYFDESEEAVKWEFHFRAAEEERLLLQVAAKVLKTGKVSTWSRMRNGRKVPNEIYIECTGKQGTEIKFLFDFYKELWKKEKEKMMQAFIQKHEIGPDPEPGKEEKMSAEDMLDLLKRMSALDDADPTLRLETA